MNLNIEFNSLITLKIDKEKHVVQYSKVYEDGIRHVFGIKGNSVNLKVLTENQFKYHKYMPEKAKLEHSSNVISPMPGAVVQLFV